MTRARLLVFPFWRDNPYQNMLYLATAAAGHEITPARTVDELYDGVDSLVAGDVVHIHWTSPIVQRAADVDDADSRLAAFVGAMRSARRRGIALVWTIHNVLPHELHHREQELRLSTFLAEEADLVHVLTHATLEAVRGLYSVDPAKTVVVPHSSYWGVYDHHVDATTARRDRGIADTDFVLALIGQLRAYKGVDVLIEAVEIMRKTDPSYRALLAGKTSAEDRARLDRLVLPSAGIVRHHEFIPDAELPAWISAADVVVIPYRRVLNSGSVLVAATFGKPVVVPDEPALREQYGDQGWAWFYAADGGPEALATMIAANRDEIIASGRAAAEWAEAHTPYAMAREFRDRVLARVAR